MMVRGQDQLVADGISAADIWLQGLGAALVSGMVAAGVALLVTNRTIKSDRALRDDEKLRTTLSDLQSAEQELVKAVAEKSEGHVRANAFAAYGSELQQLQILLGRRDQAAADWLGSLIEASGEKYLAALASTISAVDLADWMRKRRLEITLYATLGADLPTIVS